MSNDKQLIEDLLEAGEQYLLGFIRLAKEGRMDTDDLTVKRHRLVDAIDKVRKAHLPKSWSMENRP